MARVTSSMQHPGSTPLQRGSTALSGLVLACTGAGGCLGGQSHLVEIANKPLIHFGLEAMAEAGVQRATVAVDTRSQAGVREAVGDGSRFGLEVTYLESEREMALPEAVRRSRATHGDGPYLVTVGDGLLKHGFRPHLDDFLADRPDALALVPRPRADHDGHADGGGGSSGPGRSASPLGTTEGAAFLLGTDFVRLVDRPGFSDAAGLRTTDVLHRLAENGHGVRVREVEGWWKRSFEAQDLLEATRLLLEGLATQVSPSQAERATIQGGVHVHPTATLDSVVLRGPVLIGPHAHVSDSYVGPYTSIGAGAVVEGAEIEHSIVQREASIQHVGGRLEACVIGRRAAVRRSFSLPTALHLNIGDGAEVVLT